VIEIVVACVAGWAGFVVGRKVRARNRSPMTMAALRPFARPELGFRDSACLEVTHAITDVAAALRAAGLPVRERRGDLVLARGRERVFLTVADPQRVALASLDVRERAGKTLIFEAAIALVPLFGPLTVTEAAWGTFVVDGTRDHHAIENERGERIRAFARALSENMAEKAAAWREVVGEP
jgi:hypothetical protein